MDLGSVGAHIECAALVQRFAQSVDARRYDDTAAVFAVDGIFERPGATFNGRNEIYQFLCDRPAGVETRHVCTPLLLSELSGDTAAGVCYLVMFHAPVVDGAIPHFDAPAGVFEYHDKFVLTEEGWRIAHRTVKVALLATVAAAPAKAA